MSDSPEIPTSWLRLTLGDAIDYGKTIKAKPSEIPADAWVLELEDIEKDTSQLLQRLTFAERQSKSTKNRFAAGDVLYGKLRPYLNKVLIANQDGYCTTEIVPLKPNLAIYERYLFYWLKHSEFLSYVESVSHGIQMPRLGTEAGLKAPLILAPLNEQRRIVAKLDRLFARSRCAREELGRVSGLVQRYKQAVLAAACSGRLTADWREENPNVESASELLERIQKERDQRYKEEILQLKIQRKSVPKLSKFKHLNSSRNIPKNWVSISIESACLFIIDCLHSTPKFISEGEYCVDTTSIEPRKIVWSKVRKVSKEEFVERTRRMLPSKGDIIFSREGTIGTVVRIANDPSFCLGQRMMMFRFSPLILPEYAELYLQSSIFIDQYKPLIIGTSSPHLNIGEIRKMSFSVPPLNEQKEIVKRVEKLFKVIDIIEQEHQKASKLLDRLEKATLSKAFRGELVPQDPNDEPAAVLLERIQAERQTQPKRKAKSTRKPKAN
ncbi:restriction endonuclease subunit S [Limnospira platensis]|uniref:restriction endonuclease subunit S n=1 Tax=Limnospira platensis TaxID=118562 RepID=UPI0002804048|nr:type I restriction enzyme EcoKI specificity protein [Arthrospira platensis C1]UWU50421.1 type I restriction enzyme, S subunit [Arthrospira platensis C1]